MVQPPRFSRVFSAHPQLLVKSVFLFSRKKRAGYLFDNLLFLINFGLAPYLNDIAP